MKTNVFISQSGDRSRALAEALKGFIRKVIQATDPWMSTDLPKGAPWPSGLAARLSNANAGIICLTSENLSANWIMFEAGALSRTDKVWTVLLDVHPNDVPLPLSFYQHTSTTKKDMWAMIQSINRTVDAPNDESDLAELFDNLWPELQREIESIRSGRFSLHSDRHQSPRIKSTDAGVHIERDRAERELRKVKEQVDAVYGALTEGLAAINDRDARSKLLDVERQMLAIKVRLGEAAPSKSQDVYSRYNRIIDETVATDQQRSIVRYMTATSDWLRLEVLTAVGEMTIDATKIFMQRLCEAGVADSKVDGGSNYYHLKLPN